MTTFLANNSRWAKVSTPPFSKWFFSIWLIITILFIIISSVLLLSGDFVGIFLVDVYLFFSFLGPTYFSIFLVLFFSFAAILITSNFLNTFKLSLRNKYFNLFIYFYNHFLLSGFYIQIITLANVTVSLYTALTIISIGYIVIDFGMLIWLWFYNPKNAKTSTLTIKYNFKIFNIGQFISKDSQFMAKSIFPHNEIFYLQYDNQYSFRFELKNFDYGNRTSSQLEAIKRTLSDLKNSLKPQYDSMAFRLFKISHFDINEFDLSLYKYEEFSKHSAKGKIDRVFLELTFDFDSNISSLEEIIKMFVYLVNDIYMQNIKIHPITPGRLAISEWLKYFSHRIDSIEQHQTIAILKLIDEYIFLSSLDKDDKDHIEHPNFTYFKKRIESFIPGGLSEFESFFVSGKTSEHLMKLIEGLISLEFTDFYLDKAMNVKLSGIDFRFSTDSELSKFLISLFKKITSMNQYLSIYNGVDCSSFELQGHEFNTLVNNSNFDTVGFEMSLQIMNRTSDERELKFNVLNRYRQIHGKFVKEIVSATDYEKQYVEKLVPLLQSNSFKTIFKTFIFKKITDINNLIIKQTDLFFFPQKLDYAFNDNPGFTFRLVFGQHRDFIQSSLLNDFKASYLGKEGFLTSPNIFGYIGPFTQDINLDRSSSTSIFIGRNIGKNLQSELDVSVDMSQYRLSNESVGNSNGHIVVIGKSGSGKTFLTSSLLFQKALNMKVFIFDIEGEYNDFHKNKSVIENLLRVKDGNSSLDKQSLGKKYLDSFDLMSTERVINMFDIHYTDDQLKLLLTKQFHEQPLVYQKHRDFLIGFIKDIVNIASSEFDVEIGYCIDQTYHRHYEKKFPSFANSDPNHFTPLISIIDKLPTNDLKLEKLKNSLNQSNALLESFSKTKDNSVQLFPVIEDFLSEVANRIKEIETFKQNVASQVNHLSYLYEIEEKLSLLLKDAYWKKKFNQPSNVTLNKDIIIFNLKSLLNISGVVQFAKWSLMLLLNFLFVTTFDKELDEKDKFNDGIFLVIDEAHRYLRPELIKMVDFMADVSKRGRKRYVEMCIVSQNISDFYRDSDSRDLMQKARDVVRNAAYKFIFQIGSEFNDAMTFIESGFQITERDQDYIKRLSRGQCYFVQGPLELSKVYVFKDPRMDK
jgi:hypothetical protein